MDFKALPPSVAEAQEDDYRKLLEKDPENPSCMIMKVIGSVTEPLSGGQLHEVSTYAQNIDRNEGRFTPFTLALTLLSFHRSKEEIKTLDRRAHNSVSPLTDLYEHFQNAWVDICKQVRNAPNIETKRDIHGKHFHSLILSLLTVEIAKETRGDANFKFEDYFKRKDMVSTRNVYAEYLLSSESLDKKGFDRETFNELKELELKYSVLQMGAEMEAEIKKCTEGQLSETLISRVLDKIDKVSGDTTFVRVQLALLGIEGTKGHPGKALQAECEKYRDALKSVKCIEDLRNDEPKFRLVRRAVWFAQYLLVAIETKDIRKRKNGLPFPFFGSSKPDKVDEAFKYLRRFDVISEDAESSAIAVEKEILKEEEKAKQKKDQQSVEGDTNAENKHETGKRTKIGRLLKKRPGKK